MIEFSKYEGLSNDFLLVFEQRLTPEIARRMCNRYRGVGADGVILIERSGSSSGADFSFLLYNADGSIAEVSGNGLRCVGKFLYDRGLHKETNIQIEAAGDVKTLQLDVEAGKVRSVRADMGIPTQDGEVELYGHTWKLVSTGNPHAVTFLDNIDDAPVEEIGPKVETDAHFPNRTNVEFVQVAGDVLHVRFWERGVGVTNASGTGSCAATVAAGSKRATVRTLGGDLLIERDESGRLFMSGPSNHVFDGQFPVEDESERTL